VLLHVPNLDATRRLIKWDRQKPVPPREDRNPAHLSQLFSCPKLFASLRPQTDDADVATGLWPVPLWRRTRMTRFVDRRWNSTLLAARMPA
jgi:hypothetical protein